MAALVAKGELTALELTEEAIRRIEALNPQLNAIVYKMYEHARDVAKKPVPGTFSGVSFVLKDVTSHYAGTPTTHGTRLLADVPASYYDTEIVKRFKRAGLVTVAKTNTPELALTPTAAPALHGASHNPSDLDLTTGGSNGGRGAAVEHAATLCGDLGHHVEEACPRLPEELAVTRGEAFLGTIAIETARDIEGLAALVGREASSKGIEPAVWSYAHYGHNFSGVDAVRFRRVSHATARAVGPFFEDYAVYLSPTLDKPPVPLGNISVQVPNWEPFFDNIFDFMPSTSLFNITGSAGVSLPLWWNADELPIGCQFITRMGRDGLLLSLAAQIECAGGTRAAHRYARES